MQFSKGRFTLIATKVMGYKRNLSSCCNLQCNRPSYRGTGATCRNVPLLSPSQRAQDLSANVLYRTGWGRRIPSHALLCLRTRMSHLDEPHIQLSATPFDGRHVAGKPVSSCSSLQASSHIGRVHRPSRIIDQRQIVVRSKGRTRS